MPIIGYYDGSVVHVQESLKKNQHVQIIPLEEGALTGSSVAGSLKKYANHALIDSEDEAWERATVEKHFPKMD